MADQCRCDTELQREEWCGGAAPVLEPALIPCAALEVEYGVHAGIDVRKSPKDVMT